MKRILLAATALTALAFAQPASAAPVTYDFTPVASGNADIGQTEAYSVAGAPTLTAVAGVAGGSAPPSAGDTFSTQVGTTFYHLVGNNRGAGEQGLGVCASLLNFTCGSSQSGGDAGEIDRAPNEVVQINVHSLYAAYTNFTIAADSTTDGEVMGVFQSNSATSLGTLLLTLNNETPTLFTPTMDYLYFASIGPAAGGADGGNVLLHSLRVTPDVDINPLAAPEPLSIAILGTGLLGLGVAKRRRRRV